ncbi:MAG: DM13 domain-containing protein [Chitinophagales bacterium]|nr:DM13 domain-containing protein [Chitinophagales bacterium]
MKSLLLFKMICITAALSSCVKENTPSTPLNNNVDTSTAIRKYMGSFINGPYGGVSGAASIYFQNNSFILALEGVRISNGPDLHVYLSKEILPVNYIDLGSLQSVSGNQLYNIPGSPDFSQYKYALIHCQRYNHLFGSAELR